MWIFDYSDTYGSMIPVLAIGKKFWRKKVPKDIQVLLWYFFLSIILFGYSNYLADRKINNLFIYHFFSPIELFFLTNYFSKKQILKFRWSLIISFVFLVICFFNTLCFEEIKTLNSNTQSIEFLLLLILCSFFYYKYSKSNQILNFQIQPEFWIITGFFIYFSTTILLFSFYKYAIVHYRSFLFDFWDFQEIMYIVKNALIAYGILCYK